MRVRITKTTNKYKAGTIVEVSRNEAFGLIDSGVGELSKEITEQDSTTKHGNTRRLRPNDSR